MGSGNGCSVKVQVKKRHNAVKKTTSKTYNKESATEHTDPCESTVKWKGLDVLKETESVFLKR